MYDRVPGQAAVWHRLRAEANGPGQEEAAQKIGDATIPHLNHNAEHPPRSGFCGGHAGERALHQV